MILNCLICGKQMYGQNEEDDICPDCKQKHKQLMPEIKPEDYNVTENGNVLKLDNADSPTQQKIKDVLEGMKNLLLYKNHKYGDSAINPKKIFYKGDSTNSILIRLDDKLGRVMSNTEEKPRVNDVADIIGYCTLLLISMEVTSEDLKKFMD